MWYLGEFTVFGLTIIYEQKSLDKDVMHTEATIAASRQLILTATLQGEKGERGIRGRRGRLGSPGLSGAIGDLGLPGWPVSAAQYNSMCTGDTVGYKNQTILPVLCQL